MVSLCLKLKAVAAFLDVEKIKQMKGRQAHYTRSLKLCCHGDQPTRSPDISCVPTQETSRTVIGRRSTCRTALPCSRFLVPCSTILSPRSKAHQREICAGYCCCSPAPYVRPRELLEQSQLFAGRPTSGTKRSHLFLRKAQASLLARQLRGQQALRCLHDGQRCTCPAWRVHSFRCGRRPSLQFSKSFRTSPAGTHRGLRE